MLPGLQISLVVVGKNFMLPAVIVVVCSKV